MKRLIYGIITLNIVLLANCKVDPKKSDIPDIINQTTPYEVRLPSYFPPMPTIPSNPLTVEGIELGRRLFYDPILSGNNTQSCASCHQQQSAFVDANNQFSKGIDGFDGFRNSMPLFNLAWATRFNWDGRFNSLEAQVPNPIFLSFEMHEDLANAINELQMDKRYPVLFKKAFGTNEINVDRISKSISQFMRTIVSHNPKIVPGIGEQIRTPQESRGFRVFLDENKGDCFHCHEVNVFASNFKFVNNGLNENPRLDAGLFDQTGNSNDIGKFKTPSLLNLQYTAPYMHDGRFKTLEEVLEFYDTGFHDSPTLDPNLKKHLGTDGKPKPRNWTNQDKADLLAFLKSLSDTALLTNPNYAKPPN